MAGRRRGGRRNGPYRFTNNRRAALRRAQMISAKKRKRRAAITVGILAGGTAAAVLGATYGPKAKESVAKQVASFKPRMADFRNSMAARIAVNPIVKEEVQKAHALTEAPKPGRRRRRTPTATNPNPRKVTQVPPADPQAIRDAMKEEEGKNTLGGNAAKRQAERGYNDDLAQTIKDGPISGVEKALRGKKVKVITERTARRHIGARNAQLIAAGGKGQTKAEIAAEIKGMIEDGIVRPRKSVGTTPRRRSRRTLKSPTGPASEQVAWTDSQLQTAFAMEY